MRLLVLGATGRIGTEILDLARTRGHQVTAFVRSPQKLTRNPSLTIVRADAVMITDGGPEGRRVRGIRNLPKPLQGARKIAAFIAATARSADLEFELHELNGQPALVFYEGDAPFAALLLAVADDRIHRVYFHGDTGRLRYLGAPGNTASNANVISTQ